MNRFQSLRVRLLLLFGAVLFITLILIAVSVFTLVSNAERESWVGRQEEAARNAVTQVNGFLERAKAELGIISRLVESPIDLQPLLDENIRQNPGIREIIITDDQGAMLASAVDGPPVLANLFTIGQSSWFQSTLGGDPDTAFYLSEFQLSAANEPYIIMSRPTVTGGVVAFRLNLTVLANIIAETRFGNTGATYIAESDGTLAVHSDIAFVAENVSIENRPELEEVLKTPDQTWNGAYINFENRDVLGTSALIPDTSLVVITEVDRSEAFASSRNALILLTSTTIGIWVIAIGLTTQFLRVMVFRPLNNLQEGALAVEEGNLKTQITVARPDEMGQVTEAFNGMVNRLHDRDVEREKLIRDLQSAKRLAEDNSRLKSEFLSTMSHELRTPMNAIEGFTSILLGKMAGVEFNEKSEKYISRISFNSKRLLSLINDFLDLSRVESGRLDLASQPFAPKELAQRWKSEIGILAENKNLIFDLKIDPTLPAKVYGDEEALSKAIINLLGNAIKFTEKGAVSLMIENADPNWRIIVKDTGIGIPPHAREFIFEEFRQVDQTSRRKYGGTGLGLAIVQKYVRTMGGTVTLQSELGHGSTFTVTLPLQTQPEYLETVQ